MHHHRRRHRNELTPPAQYRRRPSPCIQPLQVIIITFIFVSVHREDISTEFNHLIANIPILVRFVDSPKILPNGLTAMSNGLKVHNPPIAINLSTSDGISPALLNASAAAAGLPLNLVHQPSINGSLSAQPLRTSVTSNGLQIISNSTPSVTNGKNGFRHSDANSKDQIKTISTSSEPPTKVIKLINSSNGITLASVDKDSKLISSGPLTLSQVVVSQIPLLTPTQTLRVIGHPASNGVATIELSNSNGEHSTTDYRRNQNIIEKKIDY